MFTGGFILRLAPLLLVLFALAVPALAQEERLEIAVTGVEDELADNVRNSIGGGFAPVARLGSERDRVRFLREAEQRAVIALRPYGYYRGLAKAHLDDLGGEHRRLRLEITPGPPVLVGNTDIRLEGAGAEHFVFRAWRERFPLAPGSMLDQVAWEGQKQDLLDRATEWGYFKSRLLEQRIELDLDRNRADLVLVVDTGPRAQFGDVVFQQDFLDESVLRPVPRFEAGDSYRSWVLDQFRTDLWKLGYFETIDVIERRQLDVDPPVVNLEVQLVRINRDTHQGTIGYGTDTEFRTQYRWQRHQLSRRGDSVTAGFAWQTRNEEYLLFGEYRLPRRTESQQYWVLSPSYSEREQDYELDVEGREDSIRVASGRVDNLFVRAGRVKLREPERSQQQIIETFYVEYLDESLRIGELLVDPDLGDGLQGTLLAPEGSSSLSIGIDWDWPNFRGSGFHLHGHRERAWLFTANEAWGSDANFTQAYLSSRWNLRMGDRWRLLLRGEVGWSDAAVRELSFEDNGDTFLVSLTELPFRYRFFAGGSLSVRGYDYEALSNNGIGSNNLITASVEVEYQLVENWSLAAFVDTGNAFNDWSDARLRKGAGVGVRWYTAGFPLRLDVAQGLDLDGDPWRIHFTIGSPLF